MYYYTMFNHTIECDFEIEEGIAIDKIDNADIRIEEKLPPKHVMDAIADGKFDDKKFNSLFEPPGTIIERILPVSKSAHTSWT